MVRHRRAPWRHPALVRRGFGASVEERRDRYLCDGRTDVGVKIRNGETLELKTRLTTGPVVDLGAGLIGNIERWRKWTLGGADLDRPLSPRRIDADGWIDLDKRIAKRRFLLDGIEVEYSPQLPHEPSCDVEIVDVRAAGEAAWSFAFAAHGPRGSRLATVRSAAQAVLADGGPTWRDGGLGRHASMGYPEWIGRRCR
jgi:hypothetical protein